jgi:hypothetical protein
MTGIAPILEPVQPVFPAIHHVFPTIPAILTPVTNVFDPVAGDRPAAGRALREQRSRADDGEECSNGNRIQGQSWRMHNEQPPDLSCYLVGSAARLARETSANARR